MAGVTVARIRGVPVRLHVSLLLALPLFAYAAGPRLATGAWPAAAALAAGLLVNAALHEAARVWIAHEAGARAREVVLLPLGGATRWERPPRDPRAAWRVALAGPLANLALGLLLLGGVPLDLPLAGPLAWTSLALGALGLLPADPMDGGRFLRALLAPRMGPLRAGRAAAGTGHACALALAAYGVVAGLWLLVALAALVHAGARGEPSAAAPGHALRGVRVGDVMTRPAATLPPGATLEWARDRMVAARRRALPLVEADRPVGLLRLEDAERVAADDRWWTPAGILARRDLHTFTPWEEGTEAARRLGPAGVGVVVDQDGRLLGMVEGADLARLARTGTRGGGPPG
jgi:Zn-dependent protease/CBS domain-containing protein